MGVVAILCLRPLSGWADEPLRILALGDSLTAGQGLPQDATFPTQLEAALRAQGRNVRVINAGVSGDTTAGGLARLEWSLQDQPDVIIVALGGNDSLRAIVPEATRRNLDAILERLVNGERKVLLAGMYAPRNLGTQYEEEFNRIYPELARKHAVALYPFFLDGVALEPELNQPDGIHPNRTGVAVIVERIVPYLIPLLKVDNPAE